MRIRCLYALLAFVAVGCEKQQFPAEKGNSLQTPQDEGAPTLQSQRGQVEEVLARNLRDVPIDKRYAAVTQKADDLWKLLGSFPSNDLEYVILVTARFQRELETELKGEKVPRKTVGLGPLHVSKDGTNYYMATRQIASEAAKEERFLSEVRGYRKQLRHFLSRYPNRIDSQFMKECFEKISSDRKAWLMERIVEVLGRNPNWATNECR